MNGRMNYRRPNEMMYDSEATSWVRLFRTFDVDHDGFIPTTDLKRCIREAAYSFGLNPEQVNVMTMNIDANGDRLIDFSEFCTLIVIYIYYTVESGEGVSFTGPVPTKSVLIFNPYRKEEVWRFITYMFIHIGLYHVVFNVLTQLLLGFPLELVHQWRVVVIYLAGVFSGSLLVAAVDRHVFLAGASGGVYALLAAHLAELIINWSEMEFNWLRAIVLAILIVSDAAVSIFQRYFVDRTDRVSYVSHIGGFLAGVFLGVVILRNFRYHRWEGKLWWASLIAYVFFLAITIVFIFVPNFKALS